MQTCMSKNAVNCNSITVELPIMYITQPISRSLPVRGIFPCPVANSIKIKRKTRHAARTASTCFGTSTTLFERWRHIASTLIKRSIRYAKTIDG